MDLFKRLMWLLNNTPIPWAVCIAPQEKIEKTYLNCSLKESWDWEMCVSHIRQAKSLCTETVLGGRAALLFMKIFCSHVKLCVGILSPSVETWMKGRKMNSCRRLLKPVKHQVNTNPSYFLLVLLPPQYKACRARSGGAGAPAGPAAPSCGATSAWTGAQHWHSAFAARRNLWVLPLQDSLRARVEAVPFAWAHTVLSDSKVEGGTAQRCLSLMLTLASIDRGSPSTGQTCCNLREINKAWWRTWWTEKRDSAESSCRDCTVGAGKEEREWIPNPESLSSWFTRV